MGTSNSAIEDFSLTRSVPIGKTLNTNYHPEQKFQTRRSMEKLMHEQSLQPHEFKSSNTVYRTIMPKQEIKTVYDPDALISYPPLNQTKNLINHEYLGKSSFVPPSKDNATTFWNEDINKKGYNIKQPIDINNNFGYSKSRYQPGTNDLMHQHNMLVDPNKMSASGLQDFQTLSQNLKDVPITQSVPLQPGQVNNLGKSNITSAPSVQPNLQLSGSLRIPDYNKYMSSRLGSVLPDSNPTYISSNPLNVNYYEPGRPLQRSALITPLPLEQNKNDPPAFKLKSLITCSDAPPQASFTEPRHFRIFLQNGNSYNTKCDINDPLSKALENIPTLKNYEYELYDDNNSALMSYRDKTIRSLFNPNQGVIPDIPIRLRLLPIIKQTSHNLKLAYMQSVHLFGTLDFSIEGKLGIYVYDPVTGSLKNNYYSIAQYPEFKNLSDLSAYCNADDRIFISGGEDMETTLKVGNEECELIPRNTGEPIKEALAEFLEINLFQIPNKVISPKKCLKLRKRRTWHSMIFVPPKYIYIVGGVGVRMVEAMDINSYSIWEDSVLNEERCEPSLAVINEGYLYAICGYNKTTGRMNESIEKCRLSVHPHTWQNVNINFDIQSKFDPSFFGVGYARDGLILLGGKESEEQNQSYFLKPGEQEDSITEVAPIQGIKEEERYIYKEKFFIPISNKQAVLLPIKADHVVAHILNMEEGEVHVVNF